ncbi:MAG: HlyD family efflux transporter periplasmic adaptor subunit, partial [Clostridiales bacterium]|nr:HlyD family efflux transporter periplasmic adaptor subunit [Clostridiales bacterium]
QETAAAQGYDVPEEPRKRGRKGWIIGVSVLLVIAVVLIAGRAMRLQRSLAGTSSYTPYTVSRGNITVTLSGSGTLEPADSYTVTSLISGDILSAPFEEGDIVGKDQVLFDVDSSDIESSIKQAENSLKDSENKLDSTLRQLDNLKLTATGTGSVIELNVEEGDSVQAGQTVAAIRDSDTMRITVLFQKTVAESFSVGESAVVTIGGTSEAYDGIVSNVGTVDHILTGNVIVREITVDVANPGAFSPASTAYVTIGGINGLYNGTFHYKYEGNVLATLSGTVSEINVIEGSRVLKGQVIIVLQNDSVDQQIQSARSAVESAKLALETQQKKQAEYTIKSPIAGTIVEKIYKEGDTLKAGEILCTVFDLSHLSLVLNVDELDIRKIQPGQTVTLTADAAKGTDYTGVVTKVNIKGATKNGVTSYPVTIRIDKTEGLLPGMNVDAKIVVEDLRDVLLVPVSAVMRNNYVLLQTGEQDPKTAEPGVPAGFTQTEVTLGASNDTDIVITGGLKEGDVIALLDNTPASYDYNPFAQPQNRAEDPGSAPQGQPPQPASGVSR